MIKNYRFKNFQSYYDDTYVDFEVPSKAPHSYYDYETQYGSKVAKVMGIFGANGSGKSNLLKPLSFAAWFVTSSFKKMDADDKIPVITHFASKNAPYEFEVELVIPKREDNIEFADLDFEYKYTFVLTKDRVLKEELKYKNHESKLYNRVFLREFDEESKSYKYKRSAAFPLGMKIISKCPDNCSLIAYVNRLLDDEAIDSSHITDIELVHSYFNLTVTNLTLSGRTEMSTPDKITSVLDNSPELFERVKRLITRFDIGIKDIIIESKDVISEKSGEVSSKKIPMFVHECDGEEYKLPLWLESSGTQSAYIMTTVIAAKVDQGGMAILDEFDNDFNPMLTLEILELFKHESENVSNSQLIFTTHTPQVLNILRKQHVQLVEKSDNKSEVWRIDQIEGIRERDNLYAKYISGVLGGVPNFE
ncbi:TPA: AAA family ATPase [Vibrio vulnificus]|uniref:AAA family ATPase n=1 Tax=Vibrio vulnificus TaxID=672 RepID=UPI001A30D8FB|nr:ATP-binding protein [Vibrio vulnificus]EIO3976624.1 AAA family ATPase [Vibrio vulnificus]ELK8602773.1 AAA family ATPase [Vibrio vulnificus]MCA3983832.1 AAA family ATPase [Vibrio vulnificus]MCU8435792.1 ATP-binding protein [Vibrio vulnificus]HAS8262010.1 ATP-binding protein [Vibrio vulnificus]